MDAESGKARNFGALRDIGVTAVLFSVLATASHLLEQWSATGAIVFDSHIIFSLVFWFVGGAVIGYLVWRRGHRVEVSREPEA